MNREGRRPLGRLQAWLGMLASLGSLSCAGGGTGPEARESWVEPITGIELVRLEAGRFTMGSPEHEFLRERQELEHEVTLTRPFYLGRFEVTQAQWQTVVGNNPSHFAGCGADCPVETVSLLAIDEFLGALRAVSRLPFRLPTEAEWEYGCRAGSPLPFTSGTTLGPAEANIDGSDPYPGAQGQAALNTTTPVGSYPANAWGLHDLHGNVWEWTADRHCPYPDEVVDPLAVCDSELHVIRGGSWHYGADSARCALRYTHRPQDDGPSLGFRVALDAAALESSRAR